SAAGPAFRRPATRTAGGRDRLVTAASRFGAVLPQLMGGCSRGGLVGVGGAGGAVALVPPPSPPPGLKLSRAPPRPFSASPISLGTIQSLLASPSAIFGSICRYW